jgi:hypothetical protein
LTTDVVALYRAHRNDLLFIFLFHKDHTRSDDRFIGDEDVARKFLSAKAESAFARYLRYGYRQLRDARFNGSRLLPTAAA